jgi:hypothetical protein
VDDDMDMCEVSDSEYDDHELEFQNIEEGALHAPKSTPFKRAKKRFGGGSSSGVVHTLCYAASSVSPPQPPPPPLLFNIAGTVSPETVPLFTSPRSFISLSSLPYLLCRQDARLQG